MYIRYISCIQCILRYHIYVPGSRFATTPPPVAGKNWVYFAFVLTTPFLTTASGVKAKRHSSATCFKQKGTAVQRASCPHMLITLEYRTEGCLNNEVFRGSWSWHHRKTSRLLRRHVPNPVRNSNTTMQDRTNRFTPVSLLQSTCSTYILLHISYCVTS